MSYSQDSWIKEYQSSILNFEDFLSLVELDDYKSKVFGGENSNFPFKVTKQYAERIKKREPNDPLLLQIVSKIRAVYRIRNFQMILLVKLILTLEPRI